MRNILYMLLMVKERIVRLTHVHMYNMYNIWSVKSENSYKDMRSVCRISSHPEVQDKRGKKFYCKMKYISSYILLLLLVTLCTCFCILKKRKYFYSKSDVNVALLHVIHLLCILSENK